MSRLSDAINKTVEAEMTDEGFDASLVAPALWETLDEESQKSVGIEGLTKRLKSAADKIARRAIKTMSSSQGELPFNFPGAVAMDTDGRRIKLTMKLREVEFRRAIEIRRKQLHDDEKVLKEFEAAAKAFAPYWKSHPDWTVEQCVNAIVARSSRSTA